ncbi:MAG: hypothetical protein ACRD2T_09895, partial [Thermoanaerobaculia bacterium]
MRLTGLDLRRGVHSRSRLEVGARRLGLAGGAGCLLLAAGAADAGSVFMKNGYIIQGPIVEHSEAAVVLGWTNGKLTIYRRFLEKVEFEPGEEKKVSAQPAEAPAPQPDELVRVESADDELPPDLGTIIKQYDLPTALIESRLPSGTGEPQTGTAPPADAVAGGPPEVAPAPPGGESVPGVEAAPVPAPRTGVDVPAGAPLAATAGEPSWGFTLKPPAGWRSARAEGCVSWTGDPSASGFSPSLNVTSVKRGSLKWEEACRALREDQKSPLRSYELVAEEPVEIGGLPAFQVVGKGESGAGPGPGRRVVVRQIILEKGDRL